MRHRETSDWIGEFFPGITPSRGWGGDPCWFAWAQTQSAEHNPPFFWLGRAFDVAAEHDRIEWFGERLRSAHGPESCRGDREVESRAHDVLSETCAFAWASERLGDTRLQPHEDGSLFLHVPAHGVTIAPRRIHPRRSLDAVIEGIAGLAAEAAATLPSEGARILYADIWHERMYHEHVGYRLEFTEPVEEAVRHFAGERGLGYVLTRAFEWGRPIEAWY